VEYVCTIDRLTTVARVLTGNNLVFGWWVNERGSDLVHSVTWMHLLFSSGRGPEFCPEAPFAP
jgi:hypothetical protein